MLKCIGFALIWISAALHAADSPPKDFLKSCANHLGQPASSYAHGFLRKAQPYRVTEEPSRTVFASHASAPAAREIELPPLEHGRDSWLREKWYTDVQYDFHGYNFGLRDLENDAYAANLIAATQIMETNPAFTLRVNDERREDLEILRQARVAIFKRLFYLDRGPGYEGEVDQRELFEHALANSNDDLIVVAPARLHFATPPQIFASQARVVIFLSYDRKRNFETPSVEGMLEVLNEGVEAPRELHLLERRLREEKRRDFMKRFWKDFPGQSVCQMLRIMRGHRVPEPVVYRALYESFKLAKQRGCDVLVHVAKRARLPRYQDLGFSEYRGAFPSAANGSEVLLYHRLKDLGFHQRLEYLRQKARE